jgi:hypothetical protein
MKAMALQPDDRYSSCRALADDLERWMANEPVTAWHEPLTRRARRWAKQHRTRVTAAAVIRALAGTGAVLVVQTRANTRLQIANAALADANQRETPMYPSFPTDRSPQSSTAPSSATPLAPALAPEAVRLSRILTLISSATCGLSRRYCLVFSRPCPSRTSP